MNIKLFVLFSVLLDQLLMFIVHSINFDAHIFIKGAGIEFTQTAVTYFTCLTISLTHI